MHELIRRLSMFWQHRAEVYNLTACCCIMEGEQDSILDVTHQLREERGYVPYP